VVLLPHTNLAQALSKAEQYRIALSAKAIEPLEHTVTLSFGVAEFAHSETGESFLGRADAALYRAKQAGATAWSPRKPGLSHRRRIGQRFEPGADLRRLTLPSGIRYLDLGVQNNWVPLINARQRAHAAPIK